MLPEAAQQRDADQPPRYDLLIAQSSPDFSPESNHDVIVAGQEFVLLGTLEI